MEATTQTAQLTGNDDANGGRVEDLTLATELRTLRQKQRMTAREVAQKAGVSPSLVSQIETGKASPSIGTLRKLARALDVPIASLFVANDGNGDGGPAATVPTSAAGRVVRRDERKHLILPRGKVIYELLTPDLTGEIEFVWCELDPDEPQTDLMAHAGEEVILVLEGRLVVHLADERFDLDTGDSITFDSSVAHRVQNPGPDRNVHIAAITPPSF